jgi:membrane protease YdiL (CAAX protease family)
MLILRKARNIKAFQGLLPFFVAVLVFSLFFSIPHAPGNYLCIYLLDTCLFVARGGE